MNKNKLSEIKSKIKKHAPTIAIATLFAATTVAVIRQIATSPSWEELADLNDTLPIVGGEERDVLMKDPGFDLRMITEDEYMFVRNLQP